MHKRWLVSVSVILIGGAAAYCYRPHLVEWVRASLRDFEKHGANYKIQPDSKTYDVLTKDLERWRKNLSVRYSIAKTPTDRAAVESDARAVLEQALPVLMHCWLGTPWDFNGTASGPGKGKIACGYFVATVLRDAGFKVDRYQLAKQPAENILRSFLPRESCDLTVDQAFPAFASEVVLEEPGVYLVGLDTHIGFIILANENFRFIHSSGLRPWCVVEESVDQAAALQHSSWRMLGNLTADSTVLKSWVTGKKIEVKGVQRDK